MRLCRISVEVFVPAELEGLRAGLGGIGGAGCCRCGGGNMGVVGFLGGRSGGAFGGGRAKKGLRLSSPGVFFVRVAEEALGARVPLVGEGFGTVCAGDLRPTSSSLVTELG